jgi:histidinol phosphatase-like enzyme
LDAVYYCPHHPDRGFAGEVKELKRECACRKPGTEMVESAARAMNIDLAQSWMIGDSTADIAMAERAGLRSVLVATGEGGRDRKWQAEPTLRAADFPEAVDCVLAGCLSQSATAKP